jgi:ATP-dependent DNA helicase PIF1
VRFTVEDEIMELPETNEIEEPQRSQQIVATTKTATEGEASPLSAEEGSPSPSLLFERELPDFAGMTLDDLGGVTPVCFLTGQAGTGKTFLVKNKLLNDPSYGMVVATTGVAAINLGGVTINSALGYSTVEVLRDNYIAGYLSTKLREIRNSGFRWLICDEGSMLSKKALDYIMMGIRSLNENSPDQTPLGMLIIADFAQLPPIGDVLYRDGKPVIERGREKKEATPWLFDSEEWPAFESNMIKLQQIHRQSDPKFLQGINSIRRGVGSIGASLLKQSGVEFVRVLDSNFDGTTLMAKNDEVDRLNMLRLKQLPGTAVGLTNSRWTARRVTPSEWNNVPEVLQIKDGAYVMILTNDLPDFNYVNGDCGHIREIIYQNGEPIAVAIELVRNGEIVRIGKITRAIEQKAEPEESEKAADKRVRREQRGRRSVWVMGELEFWPLRLAWGTTVHKSQGLSLDRVQIDPRARFFGSNNMSYVAVSRARTPGGLFIVGNPRDFAEKVKSDPRVKKWI